MAEETELDDTKVLTALLDLTREAIENDERLSLESYISTLPFGDMDDEMYYQYFVYFLDIAYHNDRNECSLKIIDIWRLANFEEEKFPILTTIFTLDEASIDLLSFVENLFPDSSYVKHMNNLIEYPSGPEITRAVDRLGKIYPRQPHIVYKSLLDTLEGRKNEQGGTVNLAFHECVLSLYRTTGKFAPRPSYIITPNSSVVRPNLDRLPTQEELLALADEIVDVRLNVPLHESVIGEIVKKLTEGIPGVIVDNKNQMESILYNKLKDATVDERLALLEPILENRKEYDLSDYDELFRILGPCHAMMGYKELDSHSKDICSRYGGDRMLTCYEFENFDEFGEVIDENVGAKGNYEDVEWFTGVCDLVHEFNKIEKKHYAVRIPLESGGFSGCFCSWGCVMKDDRAKGNALIRMFTKRFSKLMDLHGIYDREWKRTDYRKPVLLDDNDWDEIGKGIDDWMKTNNEYTAAMSAAINGMKDLTIIESAVEETEELAESE